MTKQRTFRQWLADPMLCAGIVVGSCLVQANRIDAKEKHPVDQSLTIVAFGDSTTAPRDNLPIYADLLRRELPRKGMVANVVNAGHGGDTTAMARKRFEHDVLRHNPNLVIIQFGINDAAIDVWRNPPATKPRVPEAFFRENLLFFIDSLRQHDTRIILMTPNPLRWTPRLRTVYGKPPYLPDQVDGFNVLLKHYAAIVRDVADAKQVPLIDIYAAYEAYDAVPGQSMDALLLDGMHPNEKGHRLTADHLLKTIPTVWNE